MKSIGTDAEPIEVLLVEDSPGDVRLTREAFKDAKVQTLLSCLVRFTQTGFGALTYAGERRDCECENCAYYCETIFHG